jgi:protein SCO1/2
MRTVTVLGALAVCAALVPACGTRSDQRTYRLQGQVLAVEPASNTANIKHEDIPGLMPAMTMPYEVRDARLLEGIVPGDLINATLVIESNRAYLSTLQKVGSAPLEASAADPLASGTSPGVDLLDPGEQVPDAQFVDQDGRPRAFTSFAGRTTVVTFMYTKCPMPAFCPFLDRSFAAIQKSLQTDPAFSRLAGNVQLVSVSFDPLNDTPPVLKAHAEKLDADPQVWTFLTGDRGEVDRFAARFGVMVSRSATDPLDITHNLRTAIVDADGKLAATYAGNEWTPGQLLADLETLVHQ